MLYAQGMRGSEGSGGSEGLFFTIPKIFTYHVHTMYDESLNKQKSK